MPTSTRRAGAVHKTYTTALLLTGDEGNAEAASQYAITVTPDCIDWEQALLDNGIGEALRLNRLRCGKSCGTRNNVSIHLPEELRAVVRLPVRLREVFVLRMLTGMVVRRVAERLDMTPAAVVRFATAAAILLSIANEQGAEVNRVRAFGDSGLQEIATS